MALRLRLLQILLAADAVILLALGVALMTIPANLGNAFQFGALPHSVSYLLGLWGCALISLGAGYGYAALDPLRNVAWVVAGIVRGVLECVFGLLMVQQHFVSWRQVAIGTVVAGAIAAGYAILYPREAVQV